MSKSKKATQVRFSLSRPLSWAEREGFYESLKYEDNIHGHSFEKDGDAFTVYADEDSRELAEFIQWLIGFMFVNVYLKAIRTDYPRIKV